MTMTILRRTLLLWLFMFWQGGFVFYGAVVVTIGAEELGDRAQGFITRHVAFALNVTGFLVLLAWLADLCMERSRFLWIRWVAWAFLLATLCILGPMQASMASLMDESTHRLTDHDFFGALHRWYLRISTFQWLAAVAFTYFTLQSWSSTDRLQRPNSVDPTEAPR